MASGGMAEIYLAKKSNADGVQKFVAFKRILAEHAKSEEFIRMFKDEAKIAVNLSHSNVVSIFDFGAERNQLYLVMEYVEGKNLRQILNKLKQQNKHLSVSHITFITKMIAAGLDHAHRCIEASTGKPLNIIHRDMSPQNVMVSYEGEVKIIDFGIAKATTQAESTRVGTLKGKFGYMSPEQVDGLEIDPRTDLFALGIMLWEMLSEQRLFLTNNEMGTLRKIRECKIPSLREIDPNIPMELEKIVNKALARNKAQRYQSAAELNKDLQGFLNRYNPDFSGQDFAEFIKEVYAEDIVEARKRQVAYAQVKVEQEEPEFPDQFDKTVAVDASTQSFAGLDAAQVNFGDLSLKAETNPTANKDKYDAKYEASGASISINQQSFIRAKNSIMSQDKKTQEASVPSFTHTGINIPEEKTSSSSFFGFLAVILAGLVGAFALVNETQPKLVALPCYTIKDFGVPITCYQAQTNSSPIASKSAVMKVTSEPEGAYIFIDSKLTSFRTPADVPVDASKPFLISVSMEGYKGKGKRFNTFPSKNEVYFKLESVPTGWITVQVVGGEAFYGDQKLKNGQKFPVEANKPILLKAKNPITHAEVEKEVTVKEGESKTVLLSPR